MKSYTFHIVIHKELEDPGYFASCPALPGCFTQGETIEETRERMKEAITGYLESMVEHSEEIPEDDVVELSQVEVTLETRIAV